MWIALFTFAITAAIALSVAASLLQSERRHISPGRKRRRSIIAELVERSR
jgi:hypothetical protein